MPATSKVSHFHKIKVDHSFADMAYPQKSDKRTKQTWGVAPNFTAMAAEMERLGTGLVYGVDIHIVGLE